METDVRKNPGLLKLDLYCKGARLDEGFLVEDVGGRKILRTRAGLGSGLEMILPGDLWTNVPVVEPRAGLAHVVVRRGEETWIDREDLGPVCPVRLSPRPTGTTARRARASP